MFESISNILKNILECNLFSLQWFAFFRMIFLVHSKVPQHHQIFPVGEQEGQQMIKSFGVNSAFYPGKIITLLHPRIWFHSQNMLDMLPHWMAQRITLKHIEMSLFIEHQTLNRTDPVINIPKLRSIIIDWKSLHLVILCTFAFWYTVLFLRDYQSLSLIFWKCFEK